MWSSLHLVWIIMKSGLCCYFSGYILKDSDYFLLFIYFLFLSALATKSSSVQPSGSSQNCTGRGGLLCSEPSTSRVGQTSSQANRPFWGHCLWGCFVHKLLASQGKHISICGEKGILMYCWWECKLVQSLWKTVCRLLKKSKTQTTIHPAIPLLGTDP